MKKRTFKNQGEPMANRVYKDTISLKEEIELSRAICRRVHRNRRQRGAIDIKFNYFNGNHNVVNLAADGDFKTRIFVKEKVIRMGVSGHSFESFSFPLESLSSVELYLPSKLTPFMTYARKENGKFTTLRKAKPWFVSLWERGEKALS